MLCTVLRCVVVVVDSRMNINIRLFNAYIVSVVAALPAGFVWESRGNQLKPNAE